MESHIDIMQAPDEFYWECNELVDRLATKGRSVYTIQQLKKNPLKIFPGTKASCKIDGRLENNNLYEILKETITNHSTQHYLMMKYDWTDKIFHSIAWKPYGKEVKRLSMGRKVAVIKYIHGWLATGTRNFYTRRQPDQRCELCGFTDNREHLFFCTNEGLADY